MSEIQRLERRVALFALIMAIICIALSLATRAQADDRLVQAVRMVESPTGKSGDSGRARSHWQIHRAAWTDVNRHRKRERLKVYDWESGTRNEFVSKVYARTYLAILRDRISSKLGRPAREREIYVAYNWGITRFARVGFQWNKVPAFVRERAQRVENICRDSKLK